jgi:hypothetical protein
MKLKVAIIFMAMLALAASADTIWTGNTSGDVMDASNWDNGLPTVASGNIGIIDNFTNGVFGYPGGVNIVIIDTAWTNLNTLGNFRPSNGSVTVGTGATFGAGYVGKFQPTGNWKFIVDGGTMAITSDYISGALSEWTNSSLTVRGGSFSTTGTIDLRNDHRMILSGSDAGTATAAAISFSDTSTLDFKPGTRIEMTVSSPATWAENAWNNNDLLYNGQSKSNLVNLSWADATNSAAGLGDGAYFVFSTNNTLSLVSPEDFFPTPSGLAATPGFNSVSLDWDDNEADDLDSYSVYRTTNSGSYGSALATNLLSSDYVDNTAVNGTTYYYVVTATGTNGIESGFSIEVSAEPRDTVAPAAPTGLAATEDDGSVSLDWADNTEDDLGTYSVYRSTSSGSYGSALATGLGSSEYIDNDVTNNTTYYYVVTATDTNGNESDQSTEIFATPAGAIRAVRLYSGDLGNDTNNTYNLTEWGPSDWKLYNGGVTNTAQSKVDGAGISDLSYTPGTAGGTYNGFLTGKNPYYSWTNGTPTLTAVNSDFKATTISAITNSTGDTISFTAVASDNESTLYLVAGVIEGDLTLTASLPGTDDVVVTYSNRSGTPNLALFRIDYSALNVGDQLTVALEKTFNVVGENGAIYIQSIALATDAEPVIPSGGYTEWVALYPALGSLTDPGDDFEPDGMDNLTEYALGGNPVANDALSVLPKGSTGSADGTNWLYYTYKRRENAASLGLTYTVRSGTNLVSGLTNVVPPSSVSSPVNGLETITHRIPTDTAPSGFMELEIELTE